MAIISPIKDKDWVSVRQAMSKLGSSKLGTNASPVFTGLTLTGLTGNRLMASGPTGVLLSVSDLTSWIAGTANRITVTDDGDGTVTITAPQDIHTGASPTFVGLTLSSFTEAGFVKNDASGILSGGNTLSIADVFGSEIIVDGGSSSITDDVEIYLDFGYSL